MSGARKLTALNTADDRASLKTRVAPKFCRSHARSEKLRWRPRHTCSAPRASEDYIYGPAETPIEQIGLSTSTPTYLSYTPSNDTWISTNQTGDETGYWGYDAYGTLAFGAPTSPFGYSGQYADATTGLVNDRARWYEAQTGGFTTRDPAFSTTDTAYTYANDDPVTNVDPSGDGFTNQWYSNPSRTWRIQLSVRGTGLKVAGLKGTLYNLVAPTPEESADCVISVVNFVITMRFGVEDRYISTLSIPGQWEYEGAINQWTYEEVDWPDFGFQWKFTGVLTGESRNFSYPGNYPAFRQPFPNHTLVFLDVVMQLASGLGPPQPYLDQGGLAFSVHS